MKRFLYLFASLLIAGGIMYYLFQDLNMTELWNNAQKLEIKWFVYSVLLGIVAFLARGLRWAVQLKAEKLEVDGFRAFFALMGGYLINLLIPRGGEVARGTLLKKSTGFSLPLLLGSILAERIVDLIILISMVFIAFLIEMDFFFLELLPTLYEVDVWSLIIKLVIIIPILLFIILFLRKKLSRSNRLVFRKFIRIWINFRKGIYSVAKIPNKTLYIFYTVVIWGSYYLMTYIIIFSLPLAEDVPWYAGFTFLAMGSLGMSMPVQGGIGTYHMMLATALTLYGIAYEKGLLLATTMHMAHTIAVIFIGGISIILINIIPKLTIKK